MILSGAVMHQRHFPVKYRFVYRVFSLRFDIDELPDIHKRLRLFSHNRFNLFSIFDRDHGPGTDEPLRPWLEGILRRQGIELEGGRVQILSFPRVLGFVFNPLSIWYCRHRDGTLRAVLCEVSNTFGERHNYLLHQQGEALPFPVKAEKQKVFHVSPFIGMNARYRFRLDTSRERLSVLIHEFQDRNLMLVASLAGRLQPVSDLRLLYVAFAYPFLTLKVVAMIHWQALKLWLKGARYYSKPAAPQQETS